MNEKKEQAIRDLGTLMAGPFAVIRRLQHIIALLCEEQDDAGILGIQLSESGMVTVHYATWYTREWAIADPTAVFPAEYLCMTDVEILENEQKLEQRTITDAEVQQAIKAREERRALFERLKSEFEPEEPKRC